MSKKISAQLHDDARDLYIEIGDDALRGEFERALNEIIRWEGLTPLDINFRETVLDHINAGLEWINEIDDPGIGYPHISEEINLIVTRAIFVLHDTGEIFGGDANKAGDSYLSPDNRRLRNRQTAGTLRLIFGQLTNEADRNQVREWYIRFDKVSTSHEQVSAITSNDKEALFARLIDLLQGNRVAQTHFFDTSKMSEETVTPEFIQKRVRILSEALFVASALRDQIVSPDAIAELDRLTSVELSLYEQTGIPRELFDEKIELTSQL